MKNFIKVLIICILLAGVSQAQVTTNPSVTGAYQAGVFTDGTTWNSSGINNTATYTTTGTAAPINFAFTNNYSSTSGGVAGINLSPTLTSTSASSGNISMITMSPTIGASANNINTARGLFLTPTVVAGYSGTISVMSQIEVNPTFSGTNAITEFDGIRFDTITNGNGITSGTITNNGVIVKGNSSAAGSGGTVLNYGANIQLGTGSASGTNNTGLYINGNGGAASVNYGIYDTSTAPNYIGGHITSSAALAAPTIASGACGTLSNGTISGTDQSGKITIASATTTSCAVTFGSSVWASAPEGCVITPASAASAAVTVLAYVSAIGTTGFTVSGSVLASTSFYYHCE